MKTRLLICLVIFVCFGASFAKAEEWPQWLGPTRNSVWNEKGISLPGEIKHLGRRYFLFPATKVIMNYHNQR